MNRRLFRIGMGIMMFFIGIFLFVQADMLGWLWIVIGCLFLLVGIRGDDRR